MSGPFFPTMTCWYSFLDILFCLSKKMGYERVLSNIFPLRMTDARGFVFGVFALSLLWLGAPGEALANRTSDPPETDDFSTHFGIADELYDIQSAQVYRHQTFAELVTSHGAPYETAVQLAEAVESEFNVREVRAGQPYRVYVNPWLQQPQYLIYEIDAIRYMVFDLFNPSESRLERRPVEQSWKRIEGTIRSSLYEALMANDAHPVLALRLSEVFAWQIDFFRIRSGDSFRVLYEERLVEGAPVEPGNILAACVDHQGEEFCGFRFDDGQGPQYFNEAGESLRRTLLKAPLRYSRISSGYTESRYHPVLKRRRPHRAVDYAAPPGTPVRSVGDGRVLKAGYYGNNGNYVKIRHNGTYETGYLHLSGFAEGIETGAEVQQGQTIGYVGSTGLSTGPHLDYRLWKRGRPVDPYELELPPTRPVSPQNKEAFDQLVQDRLQRLYPLQVFENLIANRS